MLTMEQARERVARGVALLDAKMPGWVAQIDPGSLALQSDCRCVLGQLYGSYTGCVGSRLQMTNDEAALHGFHLGTEGELEFTLHKPADEGIVECLKRLYRPLQDCWIEAIADRVVEKSPEPARDEVTA